MTVEFLRRNLRHKELPGIEKTGVRRGELLRQRADALARRVLDGNGERILLACEIPLQDDSIRRIDKKLFEHYKKNPPKGPYEPAAPLPHNVWLNTLRSRAGK